MSSSMIHMMTHHSHQHRQHHSHQHRQHHSHQHRQHHQHRHQHRSHHQSQGHHRPTRSRMIHMMMHRSHQHHQHRHQHRSLRHRMKHLDRMNQRWIRMRLQQRGQTKIRKSNGRWHWACWREMRNIRYLRQHQQSELVGRVCQHQGVEHHIVERMLLGWLV